MPSSILPIGAQVTAEEVRTEHRRHQTVAAISGFWSNLTAAKLQRPPRIAAPGCSLDAGRRFEPDVSGRPVSGAGDEGPRWVGGFLLRKNG